MTNKKEEEPRSYITASIESNLHKAISAEAKRNDQSFSKQVQEHRDHIIELEEKVDELMTCKKYLTEQLHESREETKYLTSKISELNAEIKKITDVN